MATTIFTFLSDQFQHELKTKAEIGANRFEDVMNNYKNIFWTEFGNLNNISTCVELNPKIEHLSNTNKQNLQNWLDCLQNTIAGKTTTLTTFFDELIDIYITYVSGNITSSSQKFDNLLTRHNLYNASENFESLYPITFRGRTNAVYSGYNPLKLLKRFFKTFAKATPKSVDYFYHIPFDKLHYIKNYRFSITGHPFIYLGASIPTVLLELRSNLNNFKNIELSYWGIKPNERLKMYDISNAFYDLINLNIIPLFNDSIGIKCQDTHVTPNITTFETDFKKFIISQFCTFKKKDFTGQIFVEQYVLPQLLTEQIRNYTPIKYDGFIFPSTQYLDRVSPNGKKPYYGLFKNNIALFTQYSTTNTYDNNLISKFEVRTIDKTKSLTSDNYIEELKKIRHSDVSKAKIKIKLELLKSDYDNMQLDSIVLNELNSIKLQFGAMYNFIKNL